MIANPVLQWAFTVVFLAVAVHCLVSIAGAGAPTRRGVACGDGDRAGSRAGADRGRRQATVTHVCHLVMSLDMAAMAWPWWSGLAAAPQLVVFGLAALWFAAQPLRRMIGYPGPTRRWPGRLEWSLLASAPNAPNRRGEHLVDAAMMLAMVWMVAVMANGPDLAAAGMSSSASASAGHQHGTLPPAQVAAGLVLTVTMLAAAVACATGVVGTHATHRSPTHRRAGTVTSTAMSGGMAAMCWLMVST